MLDVISLRQITVNYRFKKYVMSEDSKDRDEEKPNFFQLVLSVFAAGFGVQSSKNRERDFKHGSIKVFIVAGLIAVALFISAIVTVVSLVIDQAA